MNLPDQNDIEASNPAASSSLPDQNDIEAGAPSSSSSLPDQNDIETNEDKYGTTGQQVLTGVEGAGEGFAGPIAPLAEMGLHKLGIDKAFGIDTSSEAQAGRANTNPGIHGGTETAALIGGALTGTGEAALLERTAAKLIPEAASTIGKVGSAFLKGAIISGALQSSDEISKAVLGQGDPQSPVSSALVNIGGASLLGGATGGLFNIMGQGASKGLQSIENTKLGQNANKLLIGMGVADSMKRIGVPIENSEEFTNNSLRSLGLYEPGVLDYDTVKPGIDAHSSMIKYVSKALTDTAGGYIGSNTPAGYFGGAYLADKFVSPFAEKLMGKGAGLGGKYVFPALLRAASEGNVEGLSTIQSYAKHISRGDGLLNKAVNSLFVPGQQMINAEPSSTLREKLRKSVEDGGVTQQIENQKNEEANQQNYAEGGVVKPNVSIDKDHLSAVFPEQSVLLNTAKSRVYSYLNSIRPQKPTPALPFDTKHIMEHNQRHYDQALDIANNPLSLMKHIKDGTLTANHVKHLTQMYPEVYTELGSRITKKISENQVNEERPNYKTRQGLSLFLGSPLDSSFTPANIMAAQAVFANNQAPPPQAPKGKTKKSTTNLDKDSKSYLTPNQAGEADASKRD